MAVAGWESRTENHLCFRSPPHDSVVLLELHRQVRKRVTSEECVGLDFVCVVLSAGAGILLWYVQLL